MHFGSQQQMKRTVFNTSRLLPAHAKMRIFSLTTYMRTLTNGNNLDSNGQFRSITRLFRLALATRERYAYAKNLLVESEKIIGAEGRSRTDTPVKADDFESTASAISPLRRG